MARMGEPGSKACRWDAGARTDRHIDEDVVAHVAGGAVEDEGLIEADDTLRRSRRLAGCVPAENSQGDGATAGAWGFGRSAPTVLWWRSVGSLPVCQRVAPRAQVGC